MLAINNTKDHFRSNIQDVDDHISLRRLLRHHEMLSKPSRVETDVEPHFALLLDSRIDMIHLSRSA